MPQFDIVNHGSLIGFAPLTPEAQDWWAEHVADGPALGNVFYVEPRYAGAIIDGLADEGFI